MGGVKGPRVEGSRWPGVGGVKGPTVRGQGGLGWEVSKGLCGGRGEVAWDGRGEVA